LFSVVDLLSSDRRQWRASLLDVATEVLPSNKFEIKTSDRLTPSFVVSRERHDRYIKIEIPIDDKQRVWFQVRRKGQLIFRSEIDYAWKAMIARPTKDRMTAFWTLVRSVLY
jgi:hypothetical protein